MINRQICTKKRVVYYNCDSAGNSFTFNTAFLQYKDYWYTYTPKDLPIGSFESSDFRASKLIYEGGFFLLLHIGVRRGGCRDEPY
jgi:hypothetical protein